MTTAEDTAAAGAVEAEQLMVDTCHITRDGGPRTFDKATNSYSGGTTDVYTGKCRVKPSPLSANSSVQAGEQAVSLWPYIVSVPLSVTGVELGDLVEITDSRDPALINQQLRVRTVGRGTHLTARRLECEEVER